MLGKWEANDVADKKGLDVRLYGDTRSSEERRADYQRWRSQFVEGPPQVPPGSDLTVEQLSAMGLVGLYHPMQAEEA